MSVENTNYLAEKIARVLHDEKPRIDLHSLQTSIEKIGARLAEIEKKLETQTLNNSLASTFGLHSSNIHPSQEKFEIVEAVEQENFGNVKTEKPCIFEPNGKPCDYCSMCSSRGF